MSFASQTTPAGAASFAVKPTLPMPQLFVISSLLAALGALLALEKVAWVFGLAAAIIFFFAALTIGSGAKGATALALSFLVTFVMAQDRLARLCPSNRDLSQLRANFVSFSGRVESSKVKDTDQGRLITVEVCPDRLLSPWPKALAGRVLVHIGPYTTRGQVAPSWGGKYVFSGRLIKPRARVFSFEFDERRWLELKDIYCQVSCTAEDIQTFSAGLGRPKGQGGTEEPEPITQARPEVGEKIGAATAAPLFEYAGQIVQGTVLVREGIVAAHTRILGDERGKLLTSMVLGDRAVCLSDDIKAAFARVGLSHLLAASGLNLTIIVGAVIFLFGLARRGSRANGSLMQTLGALVCVLFFVSLAGASPSVTRATIMCLLLLWSALLFRRLATGGALAGALWLALLFDPLSILDVGLELSYGATFGIIYFYPIFIAALPEALTKKPWQWFFAICSVVISAQLAVLPVQIFYFQKISTLVLPANMLAEPLVAPITVLGFLSSLIAALAIVCAWPASTAWGTICHLPLLSFALTQVCCVIDFFCGYLVDALLWLTRFLGALPLSYLYLARPQAVSVVFYYLALTVALIIGISRPGRGALLALGAGLLLTLQSFLFSSCLEVLVTREKAVVVNPFDPPLVLLLPRCGGQTGTEQRRGATSGYLPAFHRDFAQSYLRSLSSRCQGTTKMRQLDGQSLGPIPAGQNSPAGARVGSQSASPPDLLWRDWQGIATLHRIDQGPVLVSALPAAAMEIEEAQGVKLYKFKTWGLACLLVKNLCQGNTTRPHAEHEVLFE